MNDTKDTQLSQPIACENGHFEVAAASVTETAINSGTAQLSASLAAEAPKYTRLPSIDNMRGLIIILMTFAGLLSGMACVPAWLKHPKDIGFNIVDIGAPLFLFAIALTYSAAFKRRKSTIGRGRAYGHFFGRYLAIIGLGALAMAIEGAYMGEIFGWSVLHAIGFAGLITLIFIELNPYIRIGAGLVFAIVYQVLLDNLFLQQVLDAVAMHSGFWGAFGWAAMLLMFTGLADLYFKNKKMFLAMFIVMLTAFLISFFAAKVPVSKTRVSSSFIFANAMISMGIFYFFDNMPRLKKTRIPLISWWGENPMLFYIVNMLVIALTIVICGGTDKFGAFPAWSLAIILPLVFLVMSLLCTLTHKKNIRLKL